jgi:flagellar protein FlbT
LIDGDKIPILREKDILTPDTAKTPAKLIYLAVQLMYLSPDPMAHHPTYFSLVRDILSAMPSAWPFIEGINNHILNGDVSRAERSEKADRPRRAAASECARSPGASRRRRSRPHIGIILSPFRTQHHHEQEAKRPPQGGLSHIRRINDR